MADRIFGPNRGAGTQVREREPEKNIVPGMLGSTVFVGVAERGKEDDITIVPSDKARRRKLGGLLDPADFNASSFSSLEAPLAARHFYDHSDGAGYLVFLRVTPKTNDATNDDRPDKARLLVFNREDTPKYLGYLEAHNGGRWAGQREQYLGELTGTPATDFPLDNQCQFDGMSAKDWKRDEWKGATLHIHDLSTTFTVVSNTSDGLITLAADVDLPTLWTAAAPAGPQYMVTVHRDNQNYRGQEKRMSVVFKDGALDPVAYFGMEIYVDGDLLLGDYENLSMDDTSPYYWVDVINGDVNNDLFTVTDAFTGNRLAATSRPANRYGLSDALTSTLLTLDDPFVYNVSSPGAWVPGFTFTSYGNSVVPQMITVKCTDATVGAEEFEVTTDIGNRKYTVTGDAAVGIAVATDVYMINFTIGIGTGTLALNDEFYVYVRTLYTDELVGGKVRPDVTTNKVYTIISNTATTVSVTATADLTDAGSLVGGEQFRLEWPERFGGGYDGYVAGMSSSDYEPIFDNATSKLLKLKSMNLGLVKLAIPGIAKPSDAVTLQKKALNDLCLAYNWHYRVEIPDGILTEEDALDWINNTFGRLDLAVTFFPSFNKIRDPFASSGSAARPYEISMSGMHLGREAKIANDWGGYHKAEAGVDVTFPLIIQSDVIGLPDEPVRLNEELLNPAGINVYRWGDAGEMIAWGDRTLDPTTAFRFKHKREQLSHYVNVMRENFDWAIFQINDPIADADVLASLHEYYLQEYRKRAIRGDSFTDGRNPAAIIKMDGSNNTDATRSQGDQNVDISLRFADVVERLKISVGALGIMEVG
jgi:hypothetical protein